MTKEQIKTIKDVYESNKEQLKRLREYYEEENLEEDIDYEQGYNNALELVMDVLGIEYNKEED